MLYLPFTWTGGAPPVPNARHKCEEHPDESGRLTRLKRENPELRRANEIRSSPRRSSTAERNDGGVHREPPRGLGVEPACAPTPET
jgi:hypothetical protein